MTIHIACGCRERRAEAHRAATDSEEENMSFDVEPDRSVDEPRLRELIAAANIPVLVPVVYQLTGDKRWLSPEFRPTPTRGFGEHDSGGLSDEVQAEIREGAVQALLAWTNGTTPAVPKPSADEMAQLMTTALGEPVDAEFAPMMSRHLGFDRQEPVAADPTTDGSEREFSVLIIGAGFSGLGAAVALRRNGIPFTILEKNEEVGGTWWENNYPGARVDIPTALYSYSFFGNNWAERFSQRDELAGYLQRAADHFGLREHIHFQHEVDELRWDDAEHTWTADVRGPDGEAKTYTASAVITAVGLHNRPNIPEFPGAEDFEGEIFHSARWPQDVSLEGKRVAVVGSGATSMQVVTAIADRVESMSVVQRSAHWMVPNENYFQPLPEHTNWLLQHVPFYRGWYRFRLYWFYAERIYPALLVDPEWDLSRNSVNAYSDANRRALTAYLQAQLAGRDDLIEKCTPKFPPFGKRLLIDNGWFAALKRPNVELITDSIDHLTADGFVTKDGEHHVVDTIVLCTGFQQQRVLFPMEIHGTDGRALHEEWQGDDGRAYLGMSSPGFPNLFFLYGPNTNPPGGSWITVAEDQVLYITQMLATMAREEIAAVDVKQKRHDDYNTQVDELSSKLVTALDGLDSYYRNARGRVVTNSPWTVREYWALIREPNLDDFNVTPASLLTAR
jgi:4-hydroxyacetophenone monooxygenase